MTPDPGHASRNAQPPGGAPRLPRRLLLPLLTLGLIVGALAYRALPKIDQGEVDAGIRAAAWATALAVGLALLLVTVVGHRRWHRQTVDRLRACEEQYRALVEANNDCIWEVDAAGRYTYLSPKFQDLTGYPPAEFLGRYPGELLLEDEARGGSEQWLAVIAAQQTLTVQVHHIRHRDGRVVTTESSGVPLFSPAGAYLGLRGITRDITERTRLTAALTDSETRFRLLFERHSAIMLLIDPDSGRILDANSAAADFYGYTRNELRAMNIEQINVLPPGIVTNERRQARQQWKSRFIFPHRLADGTIRTVEVASSPIPLQDKTVLFSIIHDISARERVEDELRGTRECLTAILSVMPDLLFRIDREGRILECHSASLGQLFGPPEALLGKRFTEVLPAAAARVIMAALSDAATRGRHQGAIYTLPTRQGTSWYELSIAAVGEKTRLVNDFIVLSRDITARKKAEEALRIDADQHHLLADDVSGPALPPGVASTRDAAADRPDPDRLQAQLAALRADLRGHNLQALRRFEELEPALRDLLGRAAVETLSRAIQGMRFEEALLTLEHPDFGRGGGQ